MYNALDENAVLEGVKRFGPAPGARKMMDAEMMHAMESIESGTYVTYWFEKKKIECGRIGSTSKCFCGHLFGSHNDKYFGKKFDVSCKECPCKVYKFVPTRPEECGMYWLPRRKDFNVHKWRAPCKCNHTHEDHVQNYPLRCTKCTNCPGFRAYFACISCDGAWEDHEVLYETEMERKQLGKKIRDAYKPLSGHSEIQYEVFENKNRSVDPALVRPRPKPGEVDRVPFMPMIKFKPAQMITGPDGKKTFQPPSSQFSYADSPPVQQQQQQSNQPKFNPVYDDIPVGGSGGAKFNPVYDDIPFGQHNNNNNNNYSSNNSYSSNSYNTKNTQNQIVKQPVSTMQRNAQRVMSTGKSSTSSLSEIKSPVKSTIKSPTIGVAKTISNISSNSTATSTTTKPYVSKTTQPYKPSYKK